MAGRGEEGIFMIIDLLVTSASRPALLEKTLTSFSGNVELTQHYFRGLLHEDILEEEPSKQIIVWASRFSFSVVEHHQPHIGLGPAIGYMLDNFVTSKYLFYLQDDWELVRPLDLDLAIDYMEKYPMINQIRFNKRKTMPFVGDNPKKRWYKKEVLFGDRIFTVSPHWVLNPALWRVDFISDKFVPSYEFCNWRTNDVLKQGKGPNEIDADWIAENMGTFIWGGIGEPPFFRHLGHGQSALTKTGQERQYYRR